MLDRIMKAVAAALAKDPDIISQCRTLSIFAGFIPDETPSLDELPSVQIVSTDRSRSSDLMDREHLLLLGIFSGADGYEKHEDGYFYQPGRKAHERLAARCERVACAVLLQENIVCTPVPAPEDRQWSYQGFGSFYGFALSFHDPI